MNTALGYRPDPAAVGCVDRIPSGLVLSEDTEPTVVSARLRRAVLAAWDSGLRDADAISWEAVVPVALVRKYLREVGLLAPAGPEVPPAPKKPPPDPGRSALPTRRGWGDLGKAVADALARGRKATVRELAKAAGTKPVVVRTHLLRHEGRLYRRAGTRPVPGPKGTRDVDLWRRA